MTHCHCCSQALQAFARRDLLRRPLVDGAQRSYGKTTCALFSRKHTAAHEHCDGRVLLRRPRRSEAIAGMSGRLRCCSFRGDVAHAPTPRKSSLPKTGGQSCASGFPSKRLSRTQSGAPLAPKKKPGEKLLAGIPVPDKPGFLRSPYTQNQAVIDVRGFPSGTEVVDPATGKMFVTP